MLLKSKDTLLLMGGSEQRAELRTIFRENYYLLEAENAAQAVMLLQQNSDRIILVLADLPEVDREEMQLLITATQQVATKELPVLVLAEAQNSHENEERAYLLGAIGVVLRPFSPLAIQQRVQVLVDLVLHRQRLEKMVAEQHEIIRNSNQAMLDTLSTIIEHRNTESSNHALRIRRFTQILLLDVARCCPEYALDETSIDIIASAAALHDIGKISIPDAILNKPDPLTPEEFEVMKTHTTIGGSLVQDLVSMGDLIFLRYAYNICLYHHERWDGSGYPCGLVGDKIPICAQAVGLADAFDALTTQRVYKAPISYPKSINMLLNGECGPFSPKLLKCFKHVQQQLVELAHQYADGYTPKLDDFTLPLPEPIWNSGVPDPLKLSQNKYQALLDYIGGTVFELDPDNHLYHMVHNADPTLDTLKPSASFSWLLEQLSARIHPEDLAILDEINRFVAGDLRQINQRCRTFSFLVLDPLSDTYTPRETVLFRVDAGRIEQQFIIAIYRRIDRNVAMRQPSHPQLHAAPALYGLLNSVLCCRCDRKLSIESGADELYPLTGYTAPELQQKFDGKLLHLIVPEDWSDFLASVSRCLEHNTRLDAEFRMYRKDAPPIWVLAKGRPSTAVNQQPTFYFSLLDNTTGKAAQEKLQEENRRSQYLINQANLIVFDWDLKTDTMVCSPKWAELFGYTPISKNYGERMQHASHFHPDDLPLVRSTIDALLRDTNRLIIETRIANAEGNYLWMRILAITIRNADGSARQIVGMLQNIDEQKRTASSMKEQAERDSLTKLLNRGATQSSIDTYLEQRAPNAMAAMLVLDLDNFKSVNDTRGHMCGDAVLTQVGVLLRKLVRSNDIIGRIGGDEFLVFLKDIPSTNILEERCRLLLDSLRAAFDSIMPDPHISCSIGVSLAPAHGTTYNLLFQHADEALYYVKSHQKDSYRFYDPQNLYTPYMAPARRATTKVDSDDPAAMPADSFFWFVFRKLYKSQNLDATIQELLAFIGTHFNVSRAYIFENNADNTTCSNTFEWCNTDILSEKDVLQDVSYLTDIPGWSNVFDEQGLLYCSDISKLAPQYRAILEPQGIKSILQCAILDHGVFRGYVGFDECSSNRLWTNEQVSQLEFMSEVLAVFLLNRQRDNRESKLPPPEILDA